MWCFGWNAAGFADQFTGGRVGNESRSASAGKRRAWRIRRDDESGASGRGIPHFRKRSRHNHQQHRADVWLAVLRHVLRRRTDVILADAVAELSTDEHHAILPVFAG